MMTGSVVPTAMSGRTPNAQRIPGVERSAPPIPSMPDAAPDPKPISAATSVRTNGYGRSGLPRPRRSVVTTSGRGR